MTWLEHFPRGEAAKNSQVPPEQLCLVNLTGVASEVPVQVLAQPPQRAETFQNLIGMTPQQLDETLRDPAAARALVGRLARQLDSENFHERTRARDALRLILNRAPAVVLPLIAEARNNPLSLEQALRLDAIVNDGSTVNGVTRDGLGRLTHFDSDGWEITITWSRSNPSQIDSILAVNRVQRDILNHPSHLIQRQADGTYQVSNINPLTGELFPPSGTTTADQIRIIDGNFLDYRYRLTSGREMWFNWDARPQRVR
ncbi:MAG: hypothetical protein C5B53_03080 [Candidatus Melainabacteria bacterium]|nr:MAG: hypothetical protein C5B53_03080 [Candidatus Melainabacteria bacterium]